MNYSLTGWLGVLAAASLGLAGCATGQDDGVPLAEAIATMRPVAQAWAADAVPAVAVAREHRPGFAWPPQPNPENTGVKLVPPDTETEEIDGAPGTWSALFMSSQKEGFLVVTADRGRVLSVEEHAPSPRLDNSPGMMAMLAGREVADSVRLARAATEGSPNLGALLAQDPGRVEYMVDLAAGKWAMAGQTRDTLYLATATLDGSNLTFESCQLKPGSGCRLDVPSCLCLPVAPLPEVHASGMLGPSLAPSGCEDPLAACATTPPFHLPRPARFDAWLEWESSLHRLALELLASDGTVVRRAEASGTPASLQMEGTLERGDYLFRVVGTATSGPEDWRLHAAFSERA